MNNNIVWKNLELQKIKEFPDKFPITRESIISFVNILISNATARTGISEKAIREYNKLFYEWLEFYFKSKKYLDVKDDSEEFNKLCLLFEIPIIENNLISKENITIGDVREKREEELLNYPQNSEELLSKNDNNSLTQKNNIRSEENMLSGPKPRDNENISDNTKGCEPTDYCEIGFLPQHQVYTCDDCLNLFNKLSAEEKFKFITKFKDIEFKLTPSDILGFKS